MNDLYEFGVAGWPSWAATSREIWRITDSVSRSGTVDGRKPKRCLHAPRKQVSGAFRTPQEFVGALARPRKIILMVQAGAAVDACIAGFLPYLEPGDIIMDGGNSHYPDTVRRCRELSERGIRFLGVGISGGEEGALNGPSIMPGGDESAWPEVAPYLQTIAAQVDGVPCCDWIGPEGAGHYVKMVHNGIEYADMELIAEAYCVSA